MAKAGGNGRAGPKVPRKTKGKHVPKCQCDGCDRDSWFDPNRGKYSSACGLTCLHKKCNHLGSKDEAGAAPTCIIDGCARSAFWDDRFNKYSSWCGNTCRHKKTLEDAPDAAAAPPAPPSDEGSSTDWEEQDAEDGHAYSSDDSDKDWHYKLVRKGGSSEDIAAQIEATLQACKEMKSQGAPPAPTRGGMTRLGAQLLQQQRQLSHRQDAEEAKAKSAPDEKAHSKHATVCEPPQIVTSTQHRRNQAKAKRGAQKAKAKRSAQKATAKRSAQKATAKRSAQKAKAKRSAQKATAKRSAQKAKAKHSAQKAKAKHSAQKAKAKRSAQKNKAKRKIKDGEDEPAAKRPAREAKDEPTSSDGSSSSDGLASAMGAITIRDEPKQGRKPKHNVANSSMTSSMRALVKDETMKALRAGEFPRKYNKAKILSAMLRRLQESQLGVAMITKLTKADDDTKKANKKTIVDIIRGAMRQWTKDNHAARIPTPAMSAPVIEIQQDGGNWVKANEDQSEVIAIVRTATDIIARPETADKTATSGNEEASNESPAKAGADCSDDVDNSQSDEEREAVAPLCQSKDDAEGYEIDVEIDGLDSSDNDGLSDEDLGW